MPFTELVEEGRLKSAEELRRIFAAKGVDRDSPLPPRAAPALPLL